MSSEYPESTADNPQVAAAAADPGAWRSGPLMGLVLALVGGAIAWGVLEYTSPVFRVPQQYHIFGLGAPDEKWQAYQAVQLKVDRWNSMLEFACLGALVAGMVAAGESVARRSLKPVLIAVPAGAVGGCVAGLAGSAAYRAFGAGPLAGLGSTVAVQAATLGVLGIGVGLALGLPSRSLRRVVMSSAAGMLGGILAGVLYPVAISLLQPTASTDALIPRGTVNRALWFGLSAGLLGLLSTTTACSRRPPRQSET